jgi:hypothetical protein
VSIGDRIPGSGTSAAPVYKCERCHDSGLVFNPAYRMYGGLGQGSHIPCPACDGKPRLCGEADEPTPALDAQRDLKHGGPA